MTQRSALAGRTVRPSAVLVAAVLVVAALGACSGDDPAPSTDADLQPAQVDTVEVPGLGACRMLSAADVERPWDATAAVPCTEPHNAETFAVGPLPATFDDAAHDDRRLGAFAYRRCGKAFARFLGADESAVVRSVLSWAWFRPSPDAWEEGARWYRCDALGATAGDEGTDYGALPTTARGLLRGLRPDDRWMLCARGPAVAGSEKVPCAQPHDWRAVTTVKLGGPGDPYPGDRLVEVRTRDYCSDSVGAWLGYPLDFDFGYTWFGEGEWQAGDRRSICWVKSPR